MQCQIFFGKQLIDTSLDSVTLTQWVGRVATLQCLIETPIYYRFEICDKNSCNLLRLFLRCNKGCGDYENY